MKKRPALRISPAVIIMLCAAVAGLIVEYTVHPMHHLYDSLYDNYNHYLPCRRLPEAAEVERILEEHIDTWNQVRALNPGQTNVEMRTSEECPGRADVVIWYTSRDERKAIEELLGGKTFFGVPARWRNY